MAKVLVTYGWCRTAYLAVRSLAANGHEVYSCSHLMPSMTAFSRFCVSSAKVSDPFAASELFAREVATLIKRWEIDLVMPVHEDALVLREYETILPHTTILACPVLESLRIGVDKAHITRLAEEIGVPVPDSRFPRSVEEALDLAMVVGFPLVVKVARSNSAKGVAVVKSLDELVTVLSERFAGATQASDGSFPYIQAFHEGSVVGGCFMARRGIINGYFGERYLRTKSNGIGTSVFREPYESSVLYGEIEKLVSALGWDGIGHFDFIENPETGALVLLEMNPRLWGAINLAYVNGCDFVGAAVAHAAGKQHIAEFFGSYSGQPLRSMWLIGEGIRWAHLLTEGQYRDGVKAAFEVLGSLSKTRFDDFVWHDPMPLLAEALCYGRGFLASRGDFNPG